MRKSMTDTPQTAGWDLVAAVTGALLCYSLADALGALAIVCQMMDSPAPIPWWSDLMLTVALSVQSLGLAWIGSHLGGMHTSITAAQAA